MAASRRPTSSSYAKDQAPVAPCPYTEVLRYTQTLWISLSDKRTAQRPTSLTRPLSFSTRLLRNTDTRLLHLCCVHQRDDVAARRPATPSLPGITLAMPSSPR